MTGQMTIIHPDGEYEHIDIDRVSLEEAQKRVGGYVEIVPYFNKFNGVPCTALCDEEGKLSGKPQNSRATLEWKKAAGSTGGDYLVGDIVVLTGSARHGWH